MFRRCLAIVAAVALVAPAQAEDADPGARCRKGALPFAATDANRLDDTQLREIFAGKKLGYVREHAQHAAVYLNQTRELRPDGSAVHTCNSGRGASGPWKPCPQISTAKNSVKGSRDVGVWRIANRSLCVASASFGERSDTCLAIHRRGTALAAKQLSGPRTNCIEGVVTAQ